MQAIIGTLWGTIETALAILPLAFIASFSPTLYAAQLGSSSKRHAAIHHTYAPLLGVIGALAFMLVLFRFLHPDTLMGVIDSAVGALVVSTVAAVVVGLVCIYGGIRLTLRGTNPVPPSTSPGRIGALVWFGFIRTLFSVSGLAATFLGGNVIEATNSGPVIQAALTCFFLVIASVPFLVIAHLTLRLPESVNALLSGGRNAMRRLNFRLYAGIAVITLGASIILIQVAGLLIG